MSDYVLDTVGQVLQAIFHSNSFHFIRSNWAFGHYTEHVTTTSKAVSVISGVQCSEL